MDCPIKPTNLLYPCNHGAVRNTAGQLLLGDPMFEFDQKQLSGHQLGWCLVNLSPKGWAGRPLGTEQGRLINSNVSRSCVHLSFAYEICG